MKNEYEPYYVIYEGVYPAILSDIERDGRMPLSLTDTFRVIEAKGLNDNFISKNVMAVAFRDGKFRFKHTQLSDSRRVKETESLGNHLAVSLDKYDSLPGEEKLYPQGGTKYFIKSTKGTIEDSNSIETLLDEGFAEKIFHNGGRVSLNVAYVSEKSSPLLCPLGASIYGDTYAIFSEYGAFQTSRRIITAPKERVDEGIPFKKYII